MIIRKTQSLIEFFWFIQCHPTGNILFQACHYMFALPLALTDWFKCENLGAYVDDTLAAVIVWDKQYNRINYLYTLNKYRSKGIGRKLTEVTGCDVVTTNKRSKAYWNRLGFTRHIGYGICLKED